MKYIVALALFLTSCVGKNDFPEIIRARPTENILQFSSSYWKSLGFEERRTFLEGYMMGLYSATLQVAFYHNIPHDKLKPIAIIGVSAPYLMMKVTTEYQKDVNEEQPLFRLLYAINRKIQED